MRPAANWGHCALSPLDSSSLRKMARPRLKSARWRHSPRGPASRCRPGADPALRRSRVARRRGTNSLRRLPHRDAAGQPSRRDCHVECIPEALADQPRVNRRELLGGAQHQLGRVDHFMPCVGDLCAEQAWPDRPHRAAASTRSRAVEAPRRAFLRGIRPALPPRCDVPAAPDPSSGGSLSRETRPPPPARCGASAPRGVLELRGIIPVGVSPASNAMAITLWRGVIGSACGRSWVALRSSCPWPAVFLCRVDDVARAAQRV